MFQVSHLNFFPTQDDNAQLEQQVGEKFKENLKEYGLTKSININNKLYDYTLFNHSKKVLFPKTNNVNFEKAMLREGTVLKQKGLIVTCYGREIDTNLLDDNDP